MRCYNSQTGESTLPELLAFASRRFRLGEILKAGVWKWLSTCCNLEHRAATLSQNGHPLDKIELLVLGGTWSSYPLDYQQEFVRDLFFAANTFYQRGEKRARLALVDEQRENEAAAVKIIGLTLETRPDTITLGELRRLRLEAQHPRRSLIIENLRVW